MHVLNIQRRYVNLSQQTYPRKKLNVLFFLPSHRMIKIWPELSPLLFFLFALIITYVRLVRYKDPFPARHGGEVYKH